MGPANYGRSPTRSGRAINLERLRCVEDLVSNMRLLGLEPLPEYFLLADRFVADELTLDQFSSAVNGLCRKRCSLHFDRNPPGECRGSK